MDNETPKQGRVFVQVVPLEASREIGWNSSIVEQIEARIDDIRSAIASGTRAIAESVADLPDPPRWKLGEISASFGVTLAAEAGVILSRASAGATFEVHVTFQPVGEQETRDGRSA